MTTAPPAVRSSTRILFMGSPEFAVPSLRELHRRHQVVAVVTQPDRPHGRGLSLAAPPVKVAARELGIDRILQPEKLRGAAIRDELEAVNADLFVVVAYGKILSAKTLAIPRLGCVNVHASLLPAYRGAAPIQWAVIRGERRSGVTIMLMDAGMDTGPMLLQRELELAPDETGGSLHDRLAPLGAELLGEALDAYLAGSLQARPQPEVGVTLAPMLAKEDGRVDFARPAPEVDAWIRGMDPWPGAFTSLAGDRLKLFASTSVGAPRGPAGEPGEVLSVDSRGLLVACGDGAVFVRELQLPGRRRIGAVALCTGRPIPAGTRLG
jgi:methionyl-tRNA formyltransferase